MMIDVMRTLLREMSDELMMGYALGLALTLAGGLAGRLYRNPKENPLPFGAGIIVASVVGSTLYVIFERPYEGPDIFDPNSRWYPPVGQIGYVLGSLSGLLILGMVCTVLSRGEGAHRTQIGRRLKT